VKRVICKKEYDTTNAELVHKYTYSYFGDPAGYEETLFRNPEGFYFIYVCGGESSPYPVEDIRRLAKSKVNEWIENH